MLTARFRRPACGVIFCLLLAACASFGLRHAGNPTEHGRHAGARRSSAGSQAGIESTAGRVATVRGDVADAEPVWAVKFGAEFWHDTGAASVSSRIGGVVERVSHAFAKEPGSCGVVRAAGYEARAETGGFRFIPRVPALEIQREASSAVTATVEGGTSRSTGEVVLRAVSMQRGQAEPVAFRGGEIAWTVRGNTAQRLLNADLGVVEHFEAGSRGVELAWVLERALPGEGDLAFDTLLEGARDLRRTSTGIHGFDPDGRARVAMGVATAVDAAGRRWELDTRVVNPDTGLVRVTVPESVLMLAAYPLAVDPLIGAEFGVDQPVTGPLPCTRSAPCVAAGDNGYLVVWTHGRGEATEPAVCAARVDLQGRLLDPDAILVSSAVGEQTTCAVASNPGGFLIVWSAPRGASTTDWDVLGARVDNQGVLLDRQPLAIGAVATSLQSSPAVAANGANYLVVWRDTRSTGVYGNLVGLDGKTATAAGVAISTAANDQYTPSVAALGTNYFVAWQDYRKGTSAVYQSDIYGARVSGGGTLLDTAGIAICTRTNSQFKPVVAAARDCVVVVWEDYDLGGDDLFAARVDANGVVLDPDGVPVVRGANLQANPSLAPVPQDQRVLLAWQDFRDTDSTVFASRGRAALLSAGAQPDGAITVGPTSAISPAGLCQGAPQVAAAATIDAGQGFAVWQDGGVASGTSLTEVRGALLRFGESGGTGDGSVAAESAVSLTSNPNSEMTPAIAFNGTNYLAVWADNRNGASTGLDIYGIRLAPDGSALDRSAFPVSVAPNKQYEPVVASNGAEFLVAWTDLRNTPSYAVQADIFGTIIAGDGRVLQPDGFAISNATNDQSAPAVAPLGQDFFVAWQDARKATTTPARPDIYGARVTRSGTVADPAGISVCANVSTQTSPAVGAGADGVFVAWADLRNGSTADIYGAHVGPDGLVAEVNGFAVCKASGAQTQPSVAGVGVTYLVTWTDARAGAANPDIYGAFLDRTGVFAPADGFPIATGAAIQGAPCAIPVPWSATGGDGLGDYLVAWQETGSSFPNLGDIYIARVAARVDGGRQVGVPTLLDGAAGDQVGPALAAGTTGAVLALSQATPLPVARIAGVFSSLGQAARLGSLERLTESGGARFLLTGARGATYRVEVSDDLVHWRPLLTATLPVGGGLTPVIDSGPAAARFYRAILLDTP